MLIPTIGAKNIQFRSRIEALWSHVFESLHFNWVYEPDIEYLKYYIPDFIITFANGKELLVEVKGTLNIWDKETEFKKHAEKIKNSGWEKDFIILGSNYCEGNSDEWIKIGVFFLCEHEEEDYYDGIVVRLDNENINNWSLGGDICGYDLGFTNNVDGEYWKENTNPNAPSLFDDIWSDAKNKTQWKKRSFYKLKKYT